MWDLGALLDLMHTTSSTERSTALAGGYSNCGITGYIYPTPVCGSVPLYRAHFAAANTDFIFTTSGADRDNAVRAKDSPMKESRAMFLNLLQVCIQGRAAPYFLFADLA
ncbi:hypothetical protein B0H19DRAFT_327781 [Mycena capillaripes]|nr:hypothetical protein B0H19DRAFT_327781 [Mycena capillaripes]